MALAHMDDVTILAEKGEQLALAVEVTNAIMRERGLELNPTNHTCNSVELTQKMKGGTNLVFGWIGSEPFASADRSDFFF
jgi:hypothetical protein